MTLRFAVLGAAVLAAHGFAAAPVFAQDVDFGDDSGQWVRDGECDDPRFEGVGMAASLDPVNTGADASDCRKAFMQGRVTLAPEVVAPADDGPVGAVDFGADTSPWINDGQCDDPRFEGPGMAAAPVASDEMADATDCRTLFDAGQISLIGGVPAGPADDGPVAAVDFGADTSPWINDGQCDDPRFEGPGMAAAPVASDEMADATDCRTLFDAGQISLIGGVPAGPADDGPVAPAGEIVFGDDSAVWSNDGECDDPRFEGPGMSAVPSDADMMRDATDCRMLLEAGMVSLKGGPGTAPEPAGAIDFGGDTGMWTNDGECDDPRFAGTGMADVLEDADIRADATDCRTLFDAGMITLVGDQPPGGDVVPAGSVDFGADSGQWTNDGECDDPRFVGQGMAEILQDVDRFADATDCRTLFEAGMISLAAE
jgi:hypothetical protein